MQKKYTHKGINFSTSFEFWEKTYKAGNGSGSGSYGRVAEYKAQILNSFVEDNNIDCVVDFGCGDGNQNSLFHFPKYIGLDVSKTIIEKNRAAYDGSQKHTFIEIEHTFIEIESPDRDLNLQKYQADLTISMDVVFHLIEDNVFHAYMSNLFRSSNAFVIIFSHFFEIDQSVPETKSSHTQFRNIQSWAKQHAPDYVLKGVFPNPYINADDGLGKSPCYFYIFQRTGKNGKLPKVPLMNTSPI